jgi:hypothetical protein
MRTTAWLKPLVLVGLLLTTPITPALASPKATEGSDPAAVVFDPTRVDNISLKMSTTDFNSLKEPNVTWDKEGPWLPTQMTATIAGKKIGPLKVGVHLKGAWGSWRDVTGKAGFKIKLDAFVKNQSIFGLKRLTLNNMVQDRSYIHEVMTYKIMRAAGVPAPRTGYTNVSLNGNNYGLHLNVETLDTDMLKRWGVTSTHLYKGAVPHFPDLTPGHEWQFAIESGDQGDWQDLTDFIQINELSGDEWWNAISQVADMKEITMSWATEVFAGHWDGYVINLNNYFVNFDYLGKVTMYPWGTDQTWDGAYDYFNLKAVMPNKCKTSTVCNELYLQNLAKLSHVAQSLDLEAFASRVTNAIETAIDRDPYGYGLDDAQWHQNQTVIRITQEMNTLNSLTTPWDSTLGSIESNGKIYKPNQIVYLDPDSMLEALKLNPSQLDASVSLTTETPNPGLNAIGFSITSADSQHTSIDSIQVYWLTNRQSTARMNFKAKTDLLDATSKRNLTTLANRMENSQKIELVFEVARNANKASADKKIKAILAALKTAGITVNKATKSYVSGNSTAILIKASYQN